MDSFDAAATAGLDDFLDFPSEICDGEDEDETQQSKTLTAFRPSNGTDSISSLLDLHDSSGSFPELVEEELEWISNKDAFPGVETFVGIFPDSEYDILKQNSPVSVLENSTSTTSSNTTNNSGTTIMSCCRSLHVPVRARTKHCRKRRPEGLANVLTSQVRWNQEFAKTKENNSSSSNAKLKVTSIKMGRKCLHCGSEKTPQWRAGPQGPKTLCNACGVRFKSGRLVPEYRPANSPTFSSEMHSNSHRRIIEMRKMKQMCDGSAMR